MPALIVSIYVVGKDVVSRLFIGVLSTQPASPDELDDTAQAKVLPANG